MAHTLKTMCPPEERLSGDLKGTHQQVASQAKTQLQSTNSGKATGSFRFCYHVLSPSVPGWRLVDLAHHVAVR